MQAFKNLLLLFTLISSAPALVITLNEASGKIWPEQPPTTPIPGQSPLSKCDIFDKQLLNITSIDLSPNPPARGTDLRIHATGTLHTTIDEGSYVIVEVKLGYIKIVTATFDLCEQLEDNNVGLKCPITPGAYELTNTVSIPQQVPPGKYHVTAVAYTSADEEITCLTGDVNFPAELRKVKVGGKISIRNPLSKVLSSE